MPRSVKLHCQHQTTKLIKTENIYLLSVNGIRVRVYGFFFLLCISPAILYTWKWLPTTKGLSTMHPMTKYFWCPDAKTGSSPRRFTVLPSKESAVLSQAALLGRQYHKIALRVQLWNRLQFSQGAGLSSKTKYLIVMELYLCRVSWIPHTACRHSMCHSIPLVYVFVLFYFGQIGKICRSLRNLSVRNLQSPESFNMEKSFDVM